MSVLMIRAGITRRRTAACMVVLAAAAGAALWGPVSSASAEPPTVTLTSPANGTVTNSPRVTFAGTTNDFYEFEYLQFDPVTVIVYKGATEVQSVKTGPTPFEGEVWTAGPTSPLPPGTYTAVASQSNGEVPSGANTGLSPAVSFTIDTTPPQLSVSSPSNGSSTTSTSQVVSGSAGIASGDAPAVTAQLFAGSSVGAQSPLEALTVPVGSDGRWSATFGGLPLGTYTARAQQSDRAGNVGTSGEVTFTVTSPPPPTAHTPPAASFSWFPPAPNVGEQVSLVSSSTDAFSPITAFAWALTASGPFGPGKSSLTTSFTTPGDHIVRLRVTAADGLSGISTQTIHVNPQPLTLMQPFPIVRIAGIVTSSGVNLSLLSAQAPVGSRVKVTCHGRGCPTASESRVASSSAKNKHRPSTVLIAFRRFQRSLGAGTVLEVRISKPGRIGKYTRFSIRRGKLPVRLDRCIGPAGITPITCPS